MREPIGPACQPRGTQCGSYRNRWWPIMAERVADVLWSMLVGAGVKRCYGIVGDALNPVIDGLRRNGQVEFVHVRNEEAGTFAAVAEACLTETPVAVCGTAGPGGIHLLNGLIDA